MILADGVSDVDVDAVADFFRFRMGLEAAKPCCMVILLRVSAWLGQV